MHIPLLMVFVGACFNGIITHIAIDHSFAASLPFQAKEPGLDTSMEEAGMEALGQMGRVQQVTTKQILKLNKNHNCFMDIFTLGGGHPFVQHDEGQSDGVPGKVCQQQEGGEGGRHQGVL